MAYAHLFAPPRPQDFETETGPFGRESLVERRMPDTDPGWDAARADWMSDAPLPQIVGPDSFGLHGSVGRDKQNRRGDVFKLQALLHREGHLDAEATGGPTGYWGNRDDDALRAFQKENGLSIDGYADPDGETIGTIRGFYRPQKFAQAREVATDAAPERQDPERPTLNLEKDRRKSIIDNTPARFDIADNPKEDGAAPHWRLHRLGKEAIEKHNEFIEREADRQGMDPDLVRAIMYYENADGHKFGGDYVLDVAGLSKSQRPMSIRSDIWGPLGLPADKAADPETNINASVTLLRRIIDRVDEPTPEKIGTLWNSLAQEAVYYRGARIGRVYKERSSEDPLPALDHTPHP